jgi:transposase-like protein
MRLYAVFRRILQGACSTRCRKRHLHAHFLALLGTNATLHLQIVGLRRFGGHRPRETMKDNTTMNKPVNEAKKVRQKFDKAFKERAVELWRTSGKAATEVAAELGIHPQRLSAWRTRFAPPPPGGKGAGARSAAPHNGKLRTPASGARTTTCANSATF